MDILGAISDCMKCKMKNDKKMNDIHLDVNRKIGQHHSRADEVASIFDATLFVEKLHVAMLIEKVDHHSSRGSAAKIAAVSLTSLCIPDQVRRNERVGSEDESDDGANEETLGGKKGPPQSCSSARQVHTAGSGRRSCRSVFTPRCL